MALLLTTLSKNSVSSLFTTLTSSVAEAKYSIEDKGLTLFATPITGATVEDLVKSTPISATGKFDPTLLTTSFKTSNTLYGTFFFNGTLQFTIIWTFTDGTNTMDSFMSKSNTTNYGASYTYTVISASGSTLHGPTTTSYKWCLSDSASYANIGSRQGLSADDGLWGAAGKNINGDNPGPSLIGAGFASYGFQNYNAGDSSASILYTNSVASATGTVLAYIYF